MPKKKDKKAKKQKTTFTVKSPNEGQRIVVMASRHGLTAEEVANTDIEYYRRKVNETQEKLWEARNHLSATEALYVCYLNRLAELQGHS